MRLMLDPLDLDGDYHTRFHRGEIEPRQIKFEMFKEKVQEVIRATGWAYFKVDGQTFFINVAN